MLKKFILFLSITICFLYVLQSQDNLPCRIIFYREFSYIKAAIPYKININKDAVWLKNYSYIEYQCIPGEYSIRLFMQPGEKFKLQVETGQTYYVKLYFASDLFWSRRPCISIVDDGYNSEILNNSGKQGIDENFKKPKNTIGLNLIAGFGIEQIPVLILTTGQESSISFGGGFGYGGKLGHEFSKKFDLELDINFITGTLLPQGNNATIEFKRLNVSLTPLYIIPIGDGNARRFNLGAGINCNFNPTLEIDMSEIPGGFKDTWEYQNSLGAHASLNYEMNLSKFLMAMVGLKYYYTQYNFAESSFVHPKNFDFEFVKPNGSGIDLLVGIYFQF